MNATTCSRTVRRAQAGTTESAATDAPAAVVADDTAGHSS